MQIPTLHTPRLTLRAPTLDDFDAFAEFFASERAKFVGGPVPPEQSWRFLAGELGHWALRGYGRWSVVETATDSPAGIIGLWNPEGWPEPEIGWDLWDGFQGRGYATEAALAARDHAYRTLGWPTAISLIAPGNTASKGVASRMGAAYEKMWRHARFGDVEIWRHPAADTDGSPEAYA